MKLPFYRICVVVLALLSGDHGFEASGQQAQPGTHQADRAEAAYRGGLITPPLAKPGFVLTDTTGAPFDFRPGTQGYITLLFFGYTYCPDQCPLHMANVGMALKKMPAGISDQVKLVFVTTDPARDDTLVLRRWLDRFDRRFIGLTGTEADIEAVQRAAGVPPARKTGAPNGNYAVAHANFVLAYTKDNLAHVIYPGGVSKDDWVHDLPLLIKETWSRPLSRLRPRRVENTDPQTVTLVEANTSPAAGAAAVLDIQGNSQFYRVWPVETLFGEVAGVTGVTFAAGGRLILNWII